METIKFTQEDFELLKGVVSITKNIKETYDDLCRLEVNKMKNSSEYITMIKALKFYMNEENILYKKIANDLDRICSYLVYIYPENYHDYSEILEMVKNDTVDELMKFRISEKLNKLIREFNYDDLQLDELDLDIDNEENENLLEEDDIELEIDVDDFDNELESSIELDITNTILTLLNLDDIKYVRIKDELIKFKYNMFFTMSDVEEKMIESYFEYNEPLIWQSKLLSDIQGREDKDYEGIKELYIIRILSNQLNAITELVNSKINKKNKLLNYVITEIYLRCCMLFMTNEQIESLKNNLYLFIPLLGKDDLLIEKGLIKVFNNLNKDKELPHVLSLNNKKIL